MKVLALLRVFRDKELFVGGIFLFKLRMLSFIFFLRANALFIFRNAVAARLSPCFASQIYSVDVGALVRPKIYNILSKEVSF